MPSELALILQSFLVLVDLLKKDPNNEFKKEWEKDEQEFIKAWKTGDASVVNHLFDKYYRILQET